MSWKKTDQADILNSVDAARSEIRYLVTDYPIDTLVGRYKEKAPDEGDVYIPDYQRSLQWLEDRKSYFIESVLLRVPVPPVFFYEVEGRLEIVDGSQRIRTLVEFVGNKFRLTGLEKLDVLNGAAFEDLPSILRKRFMNSPIRSFVLEEGTDESARIELFRRVNTSSKQLTEAEIRKGAYQGPFLDLVVKCANTSLFKRLAPGKGSRGNPNPESERQELVARFFVYSKFYQEFTHDVRKFIDRKFRTFNKDLTNNDISRMADEFNLVMAFIDALNPKAFFRENTQQVPRVRFEAIAVGACLALREKPELEPKDMDWLQDVEFVKMIRTDASNSGPRLRSRIEFVRDRLLEDQ
ncbi:DUF262 domain-containing protein [Aureimonas sp. ME7]|uniref:DUF262 domain-containing protein n=1 Tax=Aureimonas sp. ME7 TaxID=2744252 RepID=UPI0015FB1DCB|nr:DUF262 domain-containing protein [Aureimonas sp. ME7]